MLLESEVVWFSLIALKISHWHLPHCGVQSKWAWTSFHRLLPAGIEVATISLRSLFRSSVAALSY